MKKSRILTLQQRKKFQKVTASADRQYGKTMASILEWEQYEKSIAKSWAKSYINDGGRK